MNVAGARMGITATDPPRVTLHDRPVGYSGVARTDDAMTVEWALRLQDIGHLAAGEVFLAGNVRAPVRVGGRWEVVWPENPTFGYGANTLEFEVTAPAGFDAPLDVSVETIVLTPTALERGAAGGTVLSQPGKASVTFTVASEGPAAAIITMRQGASEYKSGRVFYVPPVRETILRGQALHRDLSARSTSSFRELRQRVTDLEDTETRDGPQPDQRAKLHLEARWMVRDLALSNPALGDRGLLFVKRHTQQTYPDVCLNHMPWVSRPGGDICILSPIAPDGTVTPLIQGRLGPGHVHGMDLSPDGRRIVFAFAQTETNEPVQDWLVRNLAYVLRNREEPIHLFEMNSDGSDLRQLTDGEWSDLDPAYMPDGDVAFVSERCGYSLQCNENDKDETSTNLYAVTPGSGDVRRLTVSKDGDYIPHMLDNGMLAYTRWEYQERSFAHIQSVWIVAPDGTGADALYKQHMNDPWALEEMRSIPDSHKISAVATGHHTLPAGPVVIIDHHVGMNDPAGLGIVTPGSLPPEGGMTGLAVPEGGVQGVGGQYMSPWPLTEKHFLTSYTYGPETDENGYALYLIDVHGTRELVYNDPDISCSIPIPLAPRRKPMQVASIREPGAEDATCIVTDIYQGVEGIERGDIKYLRIAHRLPWPYDNERGGLRYEPDIKQVQVNWTPVAILGDVPVEEDGSAYFRVPTDIPVYFQALDENRMELQRMRSFINFQKGEMRSCSGCHETRGEAPVNPGTTTALQRGPSEYIPAPWGDKAVSFLRDVQPILDRNCVSCHDGLEPAGDLDLSGGLLATYNRAYQTINLAKLVSRSNIMEDARVTKPLMFGSHRSRLVEILATTHADRVKLTEDEHLGLVMWIDGNAPYDATFINNRQDVKPYNLAADADLRTQITEVHGRRCASCHAPEQVTRMDWIDLKRPAESRFLKAPLSICGDGAYADATDEDYQALLSAVTQAVQTAWERPRRDVATLDRRASERIAGR